MVGQYSDLSRSISAPTHRILANSLLIRFSSSSRARAFLRSAMNWTRPRMFELLLPDRPRKPAAAEEAMMSSLGYPYMLYYHEISREGRFVSEVVLYRARGDSRKRAVVCGYLAMCRLVTQHGLAIGRWCRLGGRKFGGLMLRLMMDRGSRGPVKLSGAAGVNEHDQVGCAKVAGLFGMDMVWVCFRPRELRCKPPVSGSCAVHEKIGAIQKPSQLRNQWLLVELSA